MFTLLHILLRFFSCYGRGYVRIIQKDEYLFHGFPVLPSVQELNLMRRFGEILESIKKWIIFLFNSKSKGYPILLSFLFLIDID